MDPRGGVHESKGPKHRWMLAKGPVHGREDPYRARDRFEPWRWEYTA